MCPAHVPRFDTDRPQRHDTEPRRVSPRPQRLREWSHGDEENREALFS